MKMKTIEQKAKAYDEALKVLHKYDGANIMFTQDLKEEMFPELKESEEEKIFEEIYKDLHTYYMIQRDKFVLTGIKEIWDDKWSKAKAWLEKQGEKEKFIKKELGCIRGYRDEAIKRLNELEKQGEQKSIDNLTPQEAMDIAVEKCFNKDEQKPVFEMKTPEESLDIDSNTYNKIVDECVYGEQKQEWSEEDEVKINRIVACLENLNVADNDILLKDVDWLKSLRDRVKPKPKWSEEDDRMIITITHHLERQKKYQLNSTNIEQCQDWLKSLRHQNKWRPSDEQMDALLKLEEMHVLEHEKNQENAHLYMVVKSIREQLLKLREE